MKCTHCNEDLKVAKCKMESKLETETVEAVQTLVCVNRNCTIFCGDDVNNPRNVAKTIRTKVN